LSSLVNLIVELDDRWASPSQALPGIEIAIETRADDRTLAWIDEMFGGSWSSEAYAGSSVVARRDGAPVGFAAFDVKGLRFAWLRGLARERDVGLFGPFGVAPEERAGGLGRHMLARALGALRERGYARALIAAVGDERLIRYYADAVGARIAERFDRAALLGPPARTTIMASGEGSNFQAVIDAVREGALPLDLVALVSNNPRARAIERASNAGIGSIDMLPWNRADETRDAYNARLFDVVAAQRPELVLLLGWMHLLPESFVRAFPDTLNIHPAFLPLDPQRDQVVLPDGTSIPAFRGPRAVRDALAAGSSWAGATLHRVTPATDRGPVLVRKPMRLAPAQAQADVMERLHRIEHGLVRAGITRWLYERS
jgi:phosphoribosylglycinamide formyltransferase 1